MKRNMDLFRAILKATEASPSTELRQQELDEEIGKLNLDHEITAEEFGYHCGLLLHGGFVTGFPAGIGQVQITGLSNAGHDFLDDIRSDTVWNKTKQQVLDKTGTASLAIMSALAQQVVKSILFPG